MGPDSVKEVKGAVAPTDEQSETDIAGAVSNEAAPNSGVAPGSVADVSKYDCLRNFNFPAGPNKMPSADELISLEILPGTIRVVVNSPRVRDQGAENEPTYLEVLKQSLERLGQESDVVIDLGKVKYLASPIVGALSELRDKLQQNGHRLILEGDAPDVVAMLKVTGFLKTSSLAPSVETASDPIKAPIKFPTSQSKEDNAKKDANKDAKKVA